jgi:hypothetical protein
VVAQAVPAASEAQKTAAAKPKPAEDTTWNRVRNYVRKLWTPSS